MKEYNVKTDKDFFDRAASIKFDVHRVASMFQNEHAITNEEEIGEWLKDINNIVDKLERIKQEGYSHFELR